MANTNTKNVPPSVYDFTDYRAFLKARIDFEKEHGDFSYSKFALRAGFQSRSYLRTVITGKRNLSPDAISKVITGFGLSFSEGESFKALVHFNQSSDFQARRHYWVTFLKTRPKNEKTRRVNDEYLYLARMAYPILLILLRQPHIQKDLESLATMSGLSKDEVREGIATLKKLGAVTEVGASSNLSTEHNNSTSVSTSENSQTFSEQIQVTADGFVTTNDVPNIAIQTFHANMLEKAKQSISLSPNEREFQSMMVPLNKEEFLYLRQRIRALIEEVDQKFGGPRPNSEKAYALNINLIPITPDFIRPSKDEEASQKSEMPVMDKEYVL